MAQAGRARIVDVARHAGVSKTAVSFAFNQPSQLNEATLQRILAVAAELGYRPSPIARRLAARRTDQIGLVVPQSTHDIFANPFLPELIRGLGDACDAEGIAVVIVPPVRGSIERAVEGALVDGLVLLGLGPDHPELRRVRDAGTPIVALDTDAWADADVIGIEDELGAEAAGRHLVHLGHRDVAAIIIAPHPDFPGDERTGISARRLAGLRRGLGLPVDGSADGAGPIRLRVLSTTVSTEGGAAAFELLAADGLPGAIFAMSDVIAIGVMDAARNAGLALPDDLSVIGYDDVPAAAWMYPRLTTVHQPIREKGRRAATRLIELIRGDGTSPPRQDLLPTRLVVRGSTAPASGQHHREGGAVTA